MTDLIVLCMRVVDCADPVAGSVQRSCCRCGAAIWLSAETAARVDGPFSLACLKCSPVFRAARVMAASDAELEAIFDRLMGGDE